MKLSPDDLVVHAAFLGAPGSGKTTLALNVVEQLLLRGIPAILIDRKGDLCGYAHAGAVARRGQRPHRRRPCPAAPRQVDVALYTPGNPSGRPLSIALAPEGLETLPTFERQQVARFAAVALGGMMNYTTRASDQSRLAILARAIELLPRSILVSQWAWKHSLVSSTRRTQPGQRRGPPRPEAV